MFTRRTMMGTVAAFAIALNAAPAAADPAAALAALQENVLSKGPNGEDPSPASDLSLSAAEIDQIKAMNATAAIVMHYGGNDWSRAQIEGMRHRFGELGIEVIAVTDAGFKPEKQVADI